MVVFGAVLLNKPAACCPPLLFKGIVLEQICVFHIRFSACASPIPYSFRADCENSDFNSTGLPISYFMQEILSIPAFFSPLSRSNLSPKGIPQGQIRPVPEGGGFGEGQGKPPDMGVRLKRNIRSSVVPRNESPIGHSQSKILNLKSSLCTLFVSPFVFE